MTGDARQRLLVVTTIVGAAALLTAPAALGPMRLNDSFWIDWVWLDQFARELARGTLYPRWLPLSHGGLGSPVFYYYPPVAFYVASPFALAGMSIYASVIAAFFVGYLISGAAMYLWLRDDARAPLLGALLFMIAPYHLFDLYGRGAIAEFIAIGFLPLVMLGLRRSFENRRGGFALTAASYGALIATHLPLALLASLFLFAPFLVVRLRDRPSTLLRPIAALATGIALAAIYLVPALLLDPYRDSAVLWRNGYLKPSYWGVWNQDLWRSPGYRTLLVIILSIEIPLIMLIVRRRSHWAMLGALCGFLAAGIVPAFWNIPGLASVQFPHRILPIAEFALATAIAYAPAGLAFLPLAWLPLLAVEIATPGNEGLTMAQLRQDHPDVPENLPPGERPYDWPSWWALRIAATHDRPTVANGITTEPVFYFPAWQVRCAGVPVPTFPAPQTQLLSYRRTGCQRTLGTTAPERWGAAISLAALLLLAAASLGRWRLRRAPLRRNGGCDEVTP